MPVIRERFIWQAVDRVTGTEYTEDVNGLGSFTKLNTWNISKVRILEYDSSAGGYHQFEHVVPEGAEAVFVHRRKLHTGPVDVLDPANIDLAKFNWTIIGHRWPDGKGDYYFFSDVADYVYRSDNFNWV